MKAGRRRGLWLSALLFLSLPAGATDLTLYTYDSFAAPGGLGSAILPLFEKRCQCKVRMLPCGDGGQILTRLQVDSERGKPTAQLVVGIEPSLWEKGRRYFEVPSPGEWGKSVLRGYAALPADFKVEPGFLPFDYGVLTFMADRQSPHAFSGSARKTLKLSDLLAPEARRRFILENPKTSTPGLGFLLHTISVLGEEKAWDFWKELRGRWLAMPAGWSAAYGLFLRGEAPLVWSYTTSQAWHREHGDRGSAPRYEAVLFEEGQPIQVEGAALVKGALRTPAERKLAQEFLEFLISDEAQSRIALHNWMLPVLPSAAARLPESFRTLPTPKKIISRKWNSVELERILARWTRIMEGASGAAGP